MVLKSETAIYFDNFPHRQWLWHHQLEGGGVFMRDSMWGGWGGLEGGESFPSALPLEAVAASFLFWGGLEGGRRFEVRPLRLPSILMIPPIGPQVWGWQRHF